MMCRLQPGVSVHGTMLELALNWPFMSSCALACQRVDMSVSTGHSVQDQCIVMCLSGVMDYSTVMAQLSPSVQVEKQFGILGTVGVQAASAVQPTAEGASQGGREDDSTAYDQAPEREAVNDKLGYCSPAEDGYREGACAFDSHDEL